MKKSILFLLCSLFLLISCSPGQVQPVEPSAVAVVSPTMPSIPTRTLLPAITNTAPPQKTTQVPSKTTILLQVINSEGMVNVRSGPATVYPVVGKVNKNEQLTVTGTDAQAQWVQFVYPNAADGVAWIYAPFTSFDRTSNTLPVITDLPTPPVTLTPEPPRAMGTIKVINPGGQVNVRSGPGTNYPMVGKVNDGDTLSAIGAIESGDWVQFQYSGTPEGVAWIFTDYTNYDRTSMTLPPIADIPPTPTP